METNLMGWLQFKFLYRYIKGICSPQADKIFGAIGETLTWGITLFSA